MICVKPMGLAIAICLGYFIFTIFDSDTHTHTHIIHLITVVSQLVSSSFLFSSLLQVILLKLIYSFTFK